MGQTDFDTIGLAGTAVSPTAAQLNLGVQGVAASYKMARGIVAITATLQQATGLTTVVSWAVVPLCAGTTPANDGMTITAETAASTAGSINIQRWVPTANTTNTLIAATTAGTVGWLAVGT